MSTLPTELRRKLERAACDARKVATVGAHKALEALAVHEPTPYPHMDDAQQAVRRKLRAQAKQLGDGESQTKRGAYEIKHLVEKLAYDQWHRLLFARFLLENNLLISPEHAVSVSLDDCEELAPSLGLKDAWAVAARFAAVELPEIFRADDPAGGVELPVEDRKGLIQLVTSLPVEVFTASDSLGWCYQFWQAERKDQVNAAGNKIGADELPSVTQLFTEDYMVDFLLDNTLGAWWAGKCLSADSADSRRFETEADCRKAVSLPGQDWKYLRFIRVDEPSAQGADFQVTDPEPKNLRKSAQSADKNRWTPAAGTFDGWPKSAAALKALDPCMGSGHFVVAMFERLVALRMAEEKLDEADAVAAVIRDNLFGLEIDPRCTQIGAFNLALAAWRRAGHCKLPAMNLACSGLAPNTREADWLAIAGDDGNVQNGMARLYRLFKNAPVLGSLINPRTAEDKLLEASFHELQPLLEQALAQETKDDTAREMAVTARGLAKAAEILAGQFTLVATNVPYLGRGNQGEVLMEYCERAYPDAKADLATCFVERSLAFCASGASTALVTPQGWLFLANYEKLRVSLLSRSKWDVVAKLGVGAFETIGGEVVNVTLIGLTKAMSDVTSTFAGIDVSAASSPDQKAVALKSEKVGLLQQASQHKNPETRIILDSSYDAHQTRLGVFCAVTQGSSTGDDSKFVRAFWEILSYSRWKWFMTSPDNGPFSGRSQTWDWPNDHCELANFDGARVQGFEALEKQGFAVAASGRIVCGRYDGEFYNKALAALIPRKHEHSSAIWAYLESGEFEVDVRKLDQKLMVTPGTFNGVPFDLAHWQKVAAEKFPHGLPKPFSSDPTQWLFNGNPAGADQPLHAAVARLLGYQWPRQTGSSFPDCPALGPDGLEKLADDDGIVPISPAKGEGPAAERLRELLARAYGKDWNATRQEALLAQVDYAGASLEDWLRNGFFEQHCALFHHRPFIWHVWDGLKNGFSALVNYHKLTHANLEKLTFAYLGDWIRRQQAAVAAEEAGSDAKLQAAKQLQATLKLILEGEPPYDIFVRWKGLASQAIGWHPDLNDGVRMNIRPFLLAPDVGKKGAGILRMKPNCNWGPKPDRGKEPQRDKTEYPWFWKGSEFTGDRWNDVHLTRKQKEDARK